MLSGERIIPKGVPLIGVAAVDADVRGYAAGCFRFFGGRAGKPALAIAILAEMFDKDSDITVRAISGDNLCHLIKFVERKQFNQKGLVPIFQRAIRSRNKWIRLRAARGIILLGKGGHKPFPLGWDKGYEYPVRLTGKNRVEMTDTPTINMLDLQNPTLAKGGGLVFPPGFGKKYKTFIGQFHRYNAPVEYKFITQLRRFKDVKNFNKNFANTFSASAQLTGAFAPGNSVLGMPLTSVFGLNNALDTLSEPVGQYKWGFTLTSNPLKIKESTPQWKRLK